MSNLAINMNQTNTRLAQLFFVDSKPFLDAYEQSALDYFSALNPDDVDVLITNVNDDDIPELLTALAAEAIKHKGVNAYRIFPSSMQDDFFVARREGKGKAVDIQHKAASGRRYTVGFHSKGKLF